MRIWVVALCLSLLGGCAGAPVSAPPQQQVFNDHLFAPATEPIAVGDLFTVNDAMRAYLRGIVPEQANTLIRARKLFDALYRQGQLKLEYDSAHTRNAVQTFQARSGNCLSLAIMTAAFAKELGMEAQYQSVLVDETVSRDGGLYFASNHVNILLGKDRKTAHTGLTRLASDDSSMLLIDFLPPAAIGAYRTTLLDEETIVAMYMNNRAAEALAAGQLDNAYWWARQNIVMHPDFSTAYNTLGVIYHKHGNNVQAEQVLRLALKQTPDTLLIMRNLMPVLTALGKINEAAALRDTLAKIDPHPPFYYFELGMAAMRKEQFNAARELFAKEVKRAPYYHEFHFWLALANYRLGDVEQTEEQLALALEASTTQRDHALYAGKLDYLRSRQQ